MARRAVDASQFQSKKEEKSLYSDLSSLKEKTFSQLSNEDKDFLLKTMAEMMGLIKKETNEEVAPEVI